MLDGQHFILTKIIATVGPSCDRPEALARLVEQGARVFRINFSHGNEQDFARMLAAVRETARITGQHVGALGDLSGPKIRVGKVQQGGIELNPGDRVAFQHPTIVAAPDKANGFAGVFSTTLPNVITDVEPGQRLLIDDGNVRLIVSDKTGSGDDQRLIANVLTGGLVTSGKGINLPESDLKVPSLTDHDRRCAAWAVKNGIDFFALSFVRKADDVRELKALLKSLGAKTPVIAKIEKPQAIDDLDAIVDVSDAVMVARGDLGVEMDLARVPAVQKHIIRMTHEHGRPVIVATQMLQSMIESSMPTRAEVSDVANAIYDGADAVMLSGETAVGKYPEQAVRMMARIAVNTHQQFRMDTVWQENSRKLRRQFGSKYRTAALAHGVINIVRDMGAGLIVIWSQNGGGALFLSQHMQADQRVAVPIIAVSSDEQSLRRMSPLFAVLPVHMDKPQSIEAFTAAIDLHILEKGWGKAGDPFVLVAGEPVGTPRVTNTISIRYLGDACKLD